MNTMLLIAGAGLLAGMMNALAGGGSFVTLCAAHTVAVFIFMAAHAVRWREAVVMLAGAVIGGFCGANIGRRAPAGVIRVGTLVLSIAITLGFFARAYWK